LAAERCEVLRIGALHSMRKYARSIRRSYAEAGVGPGREVPVAEIEDVRSRIVVPALARGELIGVLVAESRRPVAFGSADEHVLQTVASLLASAIEHVRAVADDDPDEPATPLATAAAASGPSGDGPPERTAGGVVVRFFEVDGSVFVDGDYLIKGVAGRILWSLLRQYVDSGRVEFTNRELRLDPALDLPGYKDNLESRLILLKRRLDERAVPIAIDKTGRGRFRLTVAAPPRLDAVT
jgi:hypothetical protein